jgi:hypothetical protein
VCNVLINKMRHLYFNLECTYKEGAPCSLDLTSSSNAPADDSILLIMRERDALALSRAYENYTPIKLFSHLSPGIRLERTNSAIILIREEKNGNSRRRLLLHGNC